MPDSTNHGSSARFMDGAIPPSSSAVREQRPLIHHITTVTVNDYKHNDLHRGRPVMAEAPEEVADIAPPALVLNIGRLRRRSR